MAKKGAEARNKVHPSVNQYAGTIGSPGVFINRRGSLPALDARMRDAFPKKIFEKGKRHGKTKKK